MAIERSSNAHRVAATWPFIGHSMAIAIECPLNGHCKAVKLSLRAHHAATIWPLDGHCVAVKWPRNGHYVAM
eukprot:3767847-Lingulodinium_polyedra.AAC.1